MGVHGFGEVDNKDATKSESTGHCIKKQAPTTAYAEKKATILKTTLGHYIYLKKKKNQAKTWGTQVLKSFGFFFGKRVSIFYAHLIYQSIVTNMISKQDLLCSAKDRFFFFKNHRRWPCYDRNFFTTRNLSMQKYLVHFIKTPLIKTKLQKEILVL